MEEHEEILGIEDQDDITTNDSEDVSDVSTEEVQASSEEEPPGSIDDEGDVSAEGTEEIEGEDQDDDLEEDSDWTDDGPELMEQIEGFIPKSKSVPSEEDLRLSWLVDDFDGITENIYEAIIIAGRRARQIGRRQKQEIDDLNSAMDVVDLINNEEEEGLEPGVDHFHHMKPTVQALKELKSSTFKYSYPDDEIEEEEEE